MSLDTQLHDLLDERLDAVVPAHGDLATVLRDGRRMRRRRRIVTGAVGLLAAAAVVSGGLVLLDGTASGPRRDRAVDALGPMDFTHGLRAYGDPGYTLHIGGRTVDASAVPFLDTDALATGEGVVYYQQGDLRMVREDGTVVTLDDGDPTPGDFHPTAKGDAREPLVAYALAESGTVVLKVLDTVTGEVVASHDLGCSGTCGELVLDGIDSDAVFVRTTSGTSVWEFRNGDTMAPFAGSGTRVADVRHGVVLYDGPAPRGESSGDWRLVPGAIDAQLTFDGRHVLYWSNRLEPTLPDEDAVTLKAGPAKGLGFWTIDTDGSVLAAVPDGSGTQGNYTVYDCEVPSGSCVELGPLRPRGGDPAFVGNDM